MQEQMATEFLVNLCSQGIYFLLFSPEYWQAVVNTFCCTSKTLLIYLS